MKNLFSTLLIFSAVVQYVNATQLPDDIEYLFPLPDSRYVTPATTLILRFTEDGLPIDENTVSLTVSGSTGGDYEGNIIISSDLETIIFLPNTSFEDGDNISVIIRSVLLEEPFSYSFQIADTFVRLAKMADTNSDKITVSARQTEDPVQVINGVSVPSDFPVFEPSIMGQTEDGMLFLTTWHWFLIFKNDGTPYFYKKCGSHVWDITIQPSGILAYMEGATGKLLNDAFEVTDKFKCKHGYRTDSHDFIHLENGHVLLIAEDTQILPVRDQFPIAMDKTRVIATHVQELDKNKNVIFEWRAWDHYQLKDAIHENWTMNVVHFNHLNAFDVDFDGNILVSNRHLDEITKINRKTGEIIWRFGGQNNQFTVLNDSVPNNYQHNIRAVPGKPNHYTFFDNGNHRRPPQSRAVEYRMDPASKTAEKVWEFWLDPPGYSHWMGSVERLKNGNTLINYVVEKLPKATEVTPAGEVVYQANFVRKTETTYRTHRKVWQGQAIKPSLYAELSQSKITLIFNQFGEKTFQRYNIYADMHENPVTLIDSTSNTHIHLDQFTNRKVYYFRVTSVDENEVESDYSNEVMAFINFVPPGENLILNGDFSEADNYWTVFPPENEYTEWDFSMADRCQVTINEGAPAPSDVFLSQRNIVLHQNNRYHLEFEASSDRDRIVEVVLSDSSASLDYSRLGYIELSRKTQKYSYYFSMRNVSDYLAQILFNLGHDAGQVNIDDVQLTQVTTNVDNESATKDVETFSVDPNFPNPFNAQTRVRYETPFDCLVKIEIIDVRGRLVQKESFHKQKGIQTYSIQGATLSSGIYQLRITATSESLQKQFSQSQKMVLIK